MPVSRSPRAASSKAEVRLPVPQPTSRTLSPSRTPANSMKRAARSRLHRPIICSYCAASTATNVEDISPLRTSLGSFQAPGSKARRHRFFSRLSPATLFREMSLLGHGRRESERAFQIVAEIEIVLPGPKLQLLIDRDAADGLDDLVLRRLPQCLLLFRVGLDAGRVNLRIGDIAMGEIRHRRRRADDGGRIVELREIDIGDRETRRLIMHERRKA